MSKTKAREEPQFKPALRRPSLKPGRPARRSHALRPTAVGCLTPSGCAKVGGRRTKSTSGCTHDPAPDDVVATTADQSPNAERKYASQDQDPLLRPVAGNEVATQYTINAPNGLNWHRLDNLPGPVPAGSRGHCLQCGLHRISHEDTEQQGLAPLDLPEVEAVNVSHRHHKEGRGADVGGHFAPRHRERHRSPNTWDGRSSANSDARPGPRCQILTLQHPDKLGWGSARVMAPQRIDMRPNGSPLQVERPVKRASEQAAPVAVRRFSGRPCSRG